ncbi:26S proteasome non-ATPase regulatory subunit [Ophidiomyces ophidiicola]|nr:26S proteasome non-ATPase regulatory subunit [Ophidiomyces ophidiicola]
MPTDKRTLRSNGEKARSNSQPSNKDKPAPAARSTRSKASHKPKAAMPDDTNGTEPLENGVHGSEDVEMGGDGANANGDEEMTVVLPASKTPQFSAELDQDMAQLGEGHDPKSKALSDIKNNFVLLDRAVTHFDPRFTLRVLRSISSLRKQLSISLLSQIIIETYHRSDSRALFLLKALGKEDAFQKNDTDPDISMDIDSVSKNSKSDTPKEVIPEIDIYLSILVQIFFYDNKATRRGAEFSSALVEKLQTLNRRTLDALAARVYFYYSLCFEQLAPAPPSPGAAVVSIRQPLLTALRTAVLRKDEDVQATVINLLLRNYLSTSHISQASLFVSHTEFPQSASNSQIARYLYYLGRIRAVQLRYTEAHQHLISATRKSPSSNCAAGFYQASNKLLVVVELLMGDIPDRTIFRQPALERAMSPYLLLVQAVHVGDLDGFLKVVHAHGATFREDGTYTLVLRLRQNVIKTGIRMMSLSYSRISLRDICLRLGLDSEESAEYIVAKAIRDGVIEATIDHEHGYMKSKEIGDVYATKEPGEVFHERIQACLNLHDESVKAMRFPMNQHRLELKNAQEARERERELAKEIADGDVDDDDAGGEFDGI